MKGACLDWAHHMAVIMLWLRRIAITTIKRSLFCIMFSAHLYYYIFFLWWYHSLWSLRGKSIMKQNSSVAINSWWESHLLLIKNSNIHFLGTSCLVCLTSLATNSTLSAECFATIMSSQTFTKWLLITAFPLVFYFYFILYLAWFCFTKIKMIRKSKHPPGLSFKNCFLSVTISPQKCSPLSWAFVFIVCWQTIPSGVTTLQPNRDNRQTIGKKKKLPELSYEEQQDF